MKIFPSMIQFFKRREGGKGLKKTNQPKPETGLNIQYHGGLVNVAFFACRDVPRAGVSKIGLTGHLYPTAHVCKDERNPAIVLPVLELPISGTTQYGLFGIQLLSLSITPQRSVLVCVSSFFSVAVKYFHCMITINYNYHPILHKGKLQHRGLKEVAQGHTAGSCLIWDLNPGSSICAFRSPYSAASQCHGSGSPRGNWELIRRGTPYSLEVRESHQGGLNQSHGSQPWVLTVPGRYSQTS